MADIIQADYEDLEQVASRFGKQAQTTQEMLSKVQRTLQPLKQDGWVGLGSDAFFAEMDGKILPALRRLVEALTEAERATKQISSWFSSNEQEAANLFLSETEGGTNEDANADTGEPDVGAGGAWDTGGFVPGTGDGALEGALRDNGFGSLDGADLGETSGGEMGANEYAVPANWLEGVQDSLKGYMDAHQADLNVPSDWLDSARSEPAGGEANNAESDMSGSGASGSEAPSESSAPSGGGESGGGGGEPTGGGSSGGPSGGGSSPSSGAATPAGSTPSGNEKTATPGPLGYTRIGGTGSGRGSDSPQTPAVVYREAGPAAAAPPASGGLPIGLAALGPLLAVVGKAIKNRTERT